MRKIFLIAAIVTALQITSAWSATWYVDAPVPSSGDGTTWQSAFKTIQEGIDAASDGDAVIVGQGTYAEDVRMKGKNIVLTSTNPLSPDVVAQTRIAGAWFGVRFQGTEEETCVLRGFTICDANTGIQGTSAEEQTHATIENNVITGNWAGGVVGCDGIIRNNTIRGNHAEREGGGLANCNGLIENNLIADNCVGLWCPPPTRPGTSLSRNRQPDEIYYGAGLYRCNGTIRNNIIVRNRATEYDWGVGWAIGCGGGLAECGGTIEGNVIWGNVAENGDGGGLYECNGIIRNNTVIGNRAHNGGGLAYCSRTIRNSVIWGNTALEDPQWYGGTTPTYSCIEDWTGGGDPWGNIGEEPRFVDAENGDFRLMPGSSCIDAGFNDPELPETDIAGMHRIMFGGMSLTVDMGAYEFYINDLTPGPNPEQTTFTWSSLADKTYSIFYSDDLLTWHLAIEDFLSAGDTTTSWTDDGSLPRAPPLLVPRRFYRTVENAP